MVNFNCFTRRFKLQAQLKLRVIKLILWMTSELSIWPTLSQISPQTAHQNYQAWKVDLAFSLLL
jgi:hypothetical protein